MLDVQVAMLCNQAMNFLTSGKVPKRTGTAHPNIQPQDVFDCKDGQVVLACGNDGQFVKLCEVLKLSNLPQDERFTTNAARVRNQGTLTLLLAEAFAKRERKALVDVLEAAGVRADRSIRCGKYRRAPVKERNMLISVPHLAFRNRTAYQYAYAFHRTFARTWPRAAPPRPAHHRSIA